MGTMGKLIQISTYGEVARVKYRKKDSFGYPIYSEFLFYNDVCVRASRHESKTKVVIPCDEDIDQARTDLKNADYGRMHDQYIKDICHEIFNMLLKKRKIPIYYSRISVSENHRIFDLFVLNQKGNLYPVSVFFEQWGSVVRSNEPLKGLQEMGFTLGCEIWTQDPAVVKRKQSLYVQLNEKLLRNMLPANEDLSIRNHHEHLFEKSLTSYQFQYQIIHIAKQRELTEVTLETNHFSGEVFLLYKGDKCIQTGSNERYPYWGAEDEFVDEDIQQKVWNKVRLKIATQNTHQHFQHFKKSRLELEHIKMQQKTIYLKGEHMNDFYVEEGQQTFKSIYHIIADLFLHGHADHQQNPNTLQVAGYLKQKGFQIIQVID